LCVVNFLLLEAAGMLSFCVLIRVFEGFKCLYWYFWFGFLGFEMSLLVFLTRIFWRYEIFRFSGYLKFFHIFRRFTFSGIGFLIINLSMTIKLITKSAFLFQNSIAKNSTNSNLFDLNSAQPKISQFYDKKFSIPPKNSTKTYISIYLFLFYTIDIAEISSQRL
jgi:hypothetical protein